MNVLFENDGELCIRVEDGFYSIRHSQSNALEAQMDAGELLATLARILFGCRNSRVLRLPHQHMAMDRGEPLLLAAPEVQIQ